LRVFGSKETGELPEKADFVHPGVLAEQRERAAYLFKAIAQLPENQKTAFVLSHVEDLSQKEVAAVMEISVKAVESLLQRAKGNLRKYLEGIRP
jgi:RNA polymerase sigma-70 factor (ECF subfamily)